MSGTQPTAKGSGTISVNVDANDQEALAIARAIFGDHRVEGYTFGHRLGRWWMAIKHAFGEHSFVWTYQLAGVDFSVDFINDKVHARAYEDVVMTKRLECALCPEKRGAIEVVG